MTRRELLLLAPLLALIRPERVAATTPAPTTTDPSADSQPVLGVLLEPGAAPAPATTTTSSETTTTTVRKGGRP